jgi:hypothetical protein
VQVPIDTEPYANVTFLQLQEVGGELLPVLLQWSSLVQQTTDNVFECWLWVRDTQHTPDLLSQRLANSCELRLGKCAHIQLGLPLELWAYRPLLWADVHTALEQCVLCRGNTSEC